MVNSNLCDYYNLNDILNIIKFNLFIYLLLFLVTTARIHQLKDS